MIPSKTRTLLALTLIFGTLAFPLDAQTGEDFWKGQLELGFNGASGNSSFGILRTGGALSRLQTDLYEFELSSLFRYGKNDDRVIADDLRGTIKFDWKPASTFSPFAFITASRDQIRKIDVRVNGGAGTKWTFLANEAATTKASLSLAATLDYEDFALAAGSTEEETRGTVRLSTRFKFDHTFGSGAKIQNVTFWQPQADDFGDYIIEMSNSLSTKLLSSLSLAIEHEYLHDEVPPPGAGPNDQKFSVVLRVSF